jgi:hypothetical protein
VWLPRWQGSETRANRSTVARELGHVFAAQHKHCMLVQRDGRSTLGSDILTTELLYELDTESARGTPYRWLATRGATVRNVRRRI